MFHPRRPVPPLVGLGIALALSGCSDKPKVTELPQGEKNLRIIFRAYTNAAQRLGHSPKDVEELKPFLKDYGNPLVEEEEGEKEEGTQPPPAFDLHNPDHLAALQELFERIAEA